MAQVDHVDFVPHIQGRLSHAPWQESLLPLKSFRPQMSVLLMQHPEAAVIQIDAVSAFNHMLREVMLEEIEACCPQLLSAFALWFAREF